MSSDRRETRRVEGEDEACRRVSRRPSIVISDYCRYLKDACRFLKEACTFLEETCRTWRPSVCDLKLQVCEALSY